MGYWDNKKVLVTGGGGFAGSHVVELLIGRGARVTVADHVSDVKKRNLAAVLKNKSLKLVSADATDLAVMGRLCRGQDVVINMAATVGGVHYNSVHSGSLFRVNMAIGLAGIEATRLAGVGRFVVVSSACVYPRDCAIPTPESEGERGAPEITNEGYGWAKRMQEYLGRAYASEHKMSVAIARPYNTYGPRADFAPERSHVISALVKRVCDGENPVKVWGDGSSTRSFLYVEDFARGVLEVAEKYPQADPLNIGKDEEISVADLARAIIRLAGTGAKIEFDPSKPSGQRRRHCDVTKARRTIGFEAAVSLEEGLKKTIAWYRQNEAAVSPGKAHARRSRA